MLPLTFVSVTSITVAVQMLQDVFVPNLVAGIRTGNWAQLIQGGLTSGTTLFLLAVYTWLLVLFLVKLVAIPTRPLGNSNHG